MEHQANGGDYLYRVNIEINPDAEEFDFYLVMKSNYHTAVCRPLTRQNRVLFSTSDEVQPFVELCDENVRHLLVDATELDCSIAHLLQAVTNQAEPNCALLTHTLNVMLDSLARFNLQGESHHRALALFCDETTFRNDLTPFTGTKARSLELHEATVWAWGILSANGWIFS